MPRGKYDRKLAREMRDAKKEGGVNSPSISPTATEIKVGEGLEPAPTIPLTPNAEDLSKKYKLPRGICRCGHTGDGPLSDHADIGRGEGMGPCAASDCDCIEFFFERYTDFFAHKGLKTEASKKAIEETVKKLTVGAVVAGKEKWAEAGEVSGDGTGGSIIPPESAAGAGSGKTEPSQPAIAPEKPDAPYNGLVTDIGDWYDPKLLKKAESGAVNRTQREPAAAVSIPSPEHIAPPAYKEPSGDGKGGERGVSPAPETAPKGDSPAPETPEGKEPVICDGTPKYEPEKETGLTLNPLPLMPNRIGAPNVTMREPMDSLEEAKRILREKGFKIVEAKRPVYDLSFNPDHPNRATMAVTLSTKERVLIDLYPPTNIGEAKAIPEAYIFFSNFENGLSLKDAVRIARGIMKIVRHGEKNGRTGKE